MASDSLPAEIQQDPFALGVAAALADGMPIAELAHKVAGGNRRRAKQLRNKFRIMAATDPMVREALSLSTMGTVSAGLPRLAEALVKKGQKGYVPAIKLAGADSMPIL